jgi:hypothetical protein
MLRFPSSRLLLRASHATLPTFNSWRLSPLSIKANKIVFFFPYKLLNLTLVQKIKTLLPCLKPLPLTILRHSVPLYSYQKSERSKPEGIVTKWCSFSLPAIKSHSLFTRIFTFTFSSAILSDSLSSFVFWEFQQIYEVAIQFPLSIRLYAWNESVVAVDFQEILYWKSLHKQRSSFNFYSNRTLH